MLTAELEGSLQECVERMGPTDQRDRPIPTVMSTLGWHASPNVRVTRPRQHSRGRTPELDAYQVPRIGIYHKDSWPRFRLKAGRWLRSQYGSRLMALRSDRYR